MILGREPERTAIGALLERARRGSHGALLVVGDAGIGKSTLLGDAVDRATTMTVLRVAGIEAEADVAFAGLVTLLRPIQSFVPELTVKHRQAISGALSLSADLTNPLAVGAATLALLAIAAETRAILLAVDDAHWLDEPTTLALTFALHRLHADPIAALIAIRSEYHDGWRRMGFDELLVGGLDESATHALMSARADLHQSVSARCHAASAGNPLALLEMDARLDDAQRRGERALDSPAVIGRKLTETLGRRITSLDGDAQVAALVAALADRPSVAPIIVALQSLGASPAGLDGLERAGVVTITHGEVHFAHPLLRAAAVAIATGSARRSAHRALADALGGRPNSAERRSWHLAAAADGPDEAVALALEETAAGARGRGAPSSAATALERAARLSPAPAEATRRLTAAGDAYWDASAPDRALECWRLALEATVAASDRAGLAGRIGEAGAWYDDNPRAVEFLIAESERIQTEDPHSASGLLVRASMMSGIAGAMGRAVRLAESAVALAAGDDMAAIAARAARALALVNHGDARRAADDVEMLDGIAAGITDPDDTMLAFLQIAAFSQMVREDWPRARSTLDAVVGGARRRGAGAVLAFAVSVRADVAWRTGRWAEARADAGVAIGFSEALYGRQASFGHALLARLDACAGHDEACRERAGLADATGAAIGLTSLQMWSDAALGLLELGRSNASAAASMLDRIAVRCRAGEIGDPSFLWWQADLAEAAIATGARRLAQRTLDDLEAQQRGAPRGWAMVAIGRIRGLLATGDHDDHFESSLVAATSLGAPFERARTQLCWAEADAARRPGRASRDAADACAIFRSLGAMPWAARAETLLGASRSGTPPRPAQQPRMTATLTASELRVALAIGRGASSREAADELYVSVRTVEFHLGNIYRKLGLRSRTELALLVDREQQVSSG